jgi:hypothetical protein
MYELLRNQPLLAELTDWQLERLSRWLCARCCTPDSGCSARVIRPTGCG